MAALCFQYCCLPVFSIFLLYENAYAFDLIICIWFDCAEFGYQHEEKELCPIAFHLSGFPSLPPIP